MSGEGSGVGKGGATSDSRNLTEVPAKAIIEAIASGEAGVVTSVAGRTGAVVLAVADVAGAALDTAVVHNTGAEAVAGVKTFSSAPVVPAAAFPESAVANLTTDLAAKAATASLAAVATSGSASDLSAGTVPTARFPGGAFNGVSELVQLDSSGKMPAVDGSALTGIPVASVVGAAPLASPALTGSATAVGFAASGATSLAGPSTAIGSTNLLDAASADFETGLGTLWESPSGALSNPATMTQDSIGFLGTHSVKFVTPGSSNLEGGGIYSSRTPFGKIPANPGAQYTLSCRVKGINGATLKLSLRTTTAANGADVQATSVAFTADGTWQLQSISVTGSAAAVGIDFVVVTNGTQATTFNVDAVCVQRGTSTTYVPGYTAAAGLVPEEFDLGSVIRANNGLKSAMIRAGALPTVTPSSGTAFQCLAWRDTTLILAVTATLITGTATIALSPDNSTFTTLGVSTPGVANSVDLVNLSVPAGWWVKITLSNATVTAVYY